MEEAAGLGTTTNTTTTTNGGSANIKKQQHSNIQLSGHPVLAHKITILRSSLTPPTGFRAVLREITFHLGHEATSTLHTRPIDISIPICGGGGSSTTTATTAAAAASTTTVPTDGLLVAKGWKVVEKVALVPIMRSGLGMVESMLELLPNAAVHHIGIYKQGSMPVMYYNRLPKTCSVQVAYVLDPTIGSAHTIMSVVGLLKKVRVMTLYYKYFYIQHDTNDLFLN
jgi:uracil phosphoribosyltransferase